MTVATGRYPELLWPGIRTIWGDTYTDWEAKYTQFFTTRTSDKAWEKDQGVTGLPLAGVKDQGSPIAYLDPYQGFQKEYVHLTYALGAAVTREMWEDEQYGVIKRLPQYLARSMRQTEEVTHHTVLNEAFNSNVTGADGVSLCSSSHPNVVSGTQSNIPSTASDLTMTSLEQAFTDIMNWVDDQQLKIYVRPSKLVVPTALWAVAEKILGTDRAVGSADNDINVVRGDVSNVVTPWLTDSDAWFVITNANDNGLISYTRREAEIDRDNDFDTQNLKFITTRRWSYGFTDWKGVYGTAGA